ncbi:acyl-ACP thioesterase domain-containing protein [Streptococcus loxodontisalivarius]|uniref:Medium-chain acyl-[acyl-carrier-protein] hydrolase n=1 Tax=Streptococcus loxodontisalivarius TaxID=1349415 RepID=A0ABS2PQV2_9STRE|nr:acyl-ACP thioesterase domain-containing protein [Streptococcus loxodontisalivarius]MBM7642417.1 medium-chain acyl-[acyl-carrier-protein] hydrolase [Streptococcus loxodontisalivarius]
MGHIFRRDYQIPFYETDVNHEVKLPHLLSVALQVSGEQSLELGVSDEAIFEKYHLVWVITEYNIDIKRMPRYAETVTIETEAISYNKLFCYRYFRIFDQAGEQIMTIFCHFVLIDFDSRKVAQVPDELVAPYQVEKIKKLIRGHKYQDLKEAEETLYHVRYFDLDMNGHVNNGKYLEWMYDVLDIDFLRQHCPQSVNLKYVKEIHYGGDIQSRVERDGLVSHHDITSETGVNAQAIITWKERENHV